MRSDTVIPLLTDKGGFEVFDVPRSHPLNAVGGKPREDPFAQP